MLAQGAVGPTSNADGVTPSGGYRSAKTGEIVVSGLHGRFYEQASRGNVYSIGTATAALSANTITLTATTTPILGVWNPSTSGVNLVMLQASVQLFINTLTTPVGSGALVWASSVGNTALTLGTAPFNRKTLASSGSVAKGYTPAVALTGLTNNVVIFDGADLMNLTPITHGTITAVTTQMSAGGVQNFDGGLIVPPGGVLVLLNTTSTTTCSVAGRLMWEEVPII